MPHAKDAEDAKEGEAGGMTVRDSEARSYRTWQKSQLGFASFAPLA